MSEWRPPSGRPRGLAESVRFTYFHLSAIENFFRSSSQVQLCVKCTSRPPTKPTKRISSAKRAFDDEKRIEQNEKRTKRFMSYKLYSPLVELHARVSVPSFPPARHFFSPFWGPHKKSFRAEEEEEETSFFTHDGQSEKERRKRTDSKWIRRRKLLTHRKEK